MRIRKNKKLSNCQNKKFWKFEKNWGKNLILYKNNIWKYHINEKLIILGYYEEKLCGRNKWLKLRKILN